jgi:hypothetical protein
MTKETPEELRNKFVSKYPIITTPPIDLGFVGEFVDHLEEKEQDITPLGTSDGN